MANRPLSPHLSHWKWGPHMFVSILHRITGDGMAIVGLAMLLWWLGAMASGPEAYATFQSLVWADFSTMEWAGGDVLPNLVSIFFTVVLVGLSWAFFSHMSSGIRHFVLDSGAGYELDQNKRWSRAVPLIGIALTAAFWALVIFL
ncbi:succinate dehydrogenase, cytochrome b556 subunit [Qipengyuania sp. JC766]|uniref:succinate dehydrogenase, cytochrome b556 subunit n=1 Tax=Qipengyuania sp. JC766 TaxID=3232139 RepID=UPI003457996A